MKLLLDLQGAQSQSRHRGIGRYTLALTRALLERAKQHEVRLLLNARFGEQIDALIAMLGEQAGPDRRLVLEIPDGIRAQPGGNEWLRKASALVMRHVAANAGADIAWYSSVLEGYNDDAVLPATPAAGVASVATLYDLIPLHDPDTYLGHPRVNQWYAQGVEMLRRCDMLMAISEWARQDAIQRLGLPPERIANIGAAVDPSFTPPATAPAVSAALRLKYGITAPFVFYSGGFDARKNVPALIRAFRALPGHLRSTHQLVIAGRAGPEEMTSLQIATHKARLDPARVIYTGFVSDEELIRLYGECSLFVFPSLLEGFGLPPLEAMACGAPVIASRNASLPEVMGRSDMLFDPQSVEQISARIAAVLDCPPYAQDLRQYGLRRASQFNWSAVAARAMDTLQEVAQRQKERRAMAAAPPVRWKRVCIPAPGTALPSWMGDIDAQVLQEAPRVGTPGYSHMLYVAEPRNALMLASAIRMRPGAVLLLPDSGPALTKPDQDFYRAVFAGAGYPGLLELRDSHVNNTLLYLAPLLEHASLVLCTDQALIDQIKPLTEAMLLPESILLPAAKPATALLAAWEQSRTTHSLMREMDLVDDVLAIPGKPSDEDLAALASGIVSARRPGCIPRWLVDVSSIASKDIGTGVQRVVRNILWHWLESPPEGVRIEPVRFSEGRYRYARQYSLDLLGLTQVVLSDDPVEPHNGDTFFGLDWSVDALSAAQSQLRDWHRRGVSLQFLVHDLLPLKFPQMFHPYACGRFETWLRQVASVADRLVCVSRTTAEDLRQWLATADVPYQFTREPDLEHSPPGVDAMLGNSKSELRPAVARALQARQTLLMVGTIEPRKGYEQALDALELLWGQNVDINLIIVGRFGWLMEEFAARLGKHHEHGRRLFWLDDADDGELNILYESATALLAASWGEGYGLPLIEAARRGLPVIARDLPIFREVMGGHASYFNAPTAAELAGSLRGWLACPRQPNQRLPPWPSWGQSAQALAKVVLGQHRPFATAWFNKSG
jgi:glycosyltransferase involved in cell wall biosynthesis